MNKKEASQYLGKLVKEKIVIQKNGLSYLKLPHRDWNILLALLDRIGYGKLDSRIKEK